MIERYGMHPSGAEVLIREGESLRDALDRFDLELATNEVPTPEVSEDSAKSVLGEARGDPPDLQNPEPHLKGKLARAFAGTRRSWRSLITDRRVWLPFAAIALVIVLGIAGSAIEGAIRAQRLAAEQRQQQVDAEAQRSVKDEAAQAALEDALVGAAATLTEAEAFLISSAAYTTPSQSQDLLAAIKTLTDRMENPVSAQALEALRRRVANLIAEVGPADTPAQATRRQIELDAIASAKAKEVADAAAFAALAAAKEAYVQAVVASGVAVDASSRSEILRRGQDFCARLAAGDQSPESLLNTLRVSATGFVAVAAVSAFCPQYSEWAALAPTSFGNGSRVIGAAIPEGTYRTINTGLKNCYWERSDSSGNIVDNNFITFAPDAIYVTVYSGEGFTTQGCGLWVRG